MRHRVILAAAFLSLLPSPTSAQHQEQPSLASALERLAQAGNADAAYHLGMIYHLGLEGVARDEQRAFRYFLRAAEAGDPLGAYKVGCFYAGQGEGVVAADPVLALRYKLQAAEGGYDLAQFDVAGMYNRTGPIHEAQRWLEAAAHQGYEQAIYGLLYLYRRAAHGRTDLERGSTAN